MLTLLSMPTQMMGQAWHVEANGLVTPILGMVHLYVLEENIPVTFTQSMDLAWHVVANILVTFTL